MLVARMEFKGKALVNILLYSTMFIPATALTYPGLQPGKSPASV